MTLALFAEPPVAPWAEPIVPGAVWLHGFASAAAPRLHDGLAGVLAAAPWRHMQTPGGRTMSVAMTNAGALGWVSDRRGYRYDARDPSTGRAWPVMPPAWRRLAVDAAAAAGFANFAPDAVLVNRYEAGTRLALHQDRDEHDFGAPIVSVSLGLPAVFLFGAFQRAAPAARLALQHGDVVVWGGPARLRFHGVLPLRPGEHAEWGAQRINLTFRTAG